MLRRIRRAAPFLLAVYPCLVAGMAFYVGSGTFNSTVRIAAPVLGVVMLGCSGAIGIVNYRKVKQAQLEESGLNGDVYDEANGSGTRDSRGDAG